MLFIELSEYFQQIAYLVNSYFAFVHYLFMISLLFVISS